MNVLEATGHQKERVIGIIHNTYLLRGGEDQVMEDEYCLLKDNGYSVKLFLYKNPAGKVAQFLTYLISSFNPFSFFKTVRWLRENKIAVLHVHNWFFTTSPGVFWAARYCKVPVVATLHNYRMICPSGTLTFNGRPYDKNLTTGFSWQAVRDGVYRNSSLLTFILAFTLWLNKLIGTWKIASRYVVLTPHAIKVFQSSHLSELIKKMVVKPNFVKAPDKLSTIKRKDHFLFVGRLSEEKGILVLLNAFRDSSHQLVIIGEGPLSEQVRIATAKAKNITYHGFRDRAFIYEQLRECSALVFPSVWYETFGLILIEALASGTPVIAADIGSAGFIIKDGYNGLHFESGNKTALTVQLNKWADFNEVTKTQFRKNAFESYQAAYTPEKNLELLTEIYEDLLADYE